VKQEVVIQPAGINTAAPRATAITPPISYVQQAANFTAIQERFEGSETTKKGSNLGRLFSKVQKNTSSTVSSPDGYAKPTPRRKQAHFATPAHTQAPSLPATATDGTSLSPQRIVDLCSSLQNCQASSLGVIVDDFDRQFHLCKSLSPGPATAAPDTARLIPLPELLDAYHQANIDIARQRRFEMAAHIASALLQIQTSPWLSTGWSKHDFYFLADSHTLYSERPYVSQTFVSGITDSLVPAACTSNDPFPPISEEDTRTSLFTVGVIILELIFGHNIESCSFRHLYYGANNQPNDQTDISTARKWAQKVLGECGVEIADVVRRCLDCSFGPRPSFEDKRFREAVYEGVIRQLTDHLKTWQVVML
jgi:hypothetical protein